MISDGIPPERLASDDDLIGPYYLWRLLIDKRHQHRGYGTAVLDEIVGYLRTRPGADVLGQAPPREKGHRSRSTSATASCRRARS